VGHKPCITVTHGIVGMSQFTACAPPAKLDAWSGHALRSLRGKCCMSQLPTLSKSTLAWRLVPLGLVGVFFGCGAWLQAHVHLNHDVAWITHSAGWLLEGRQFGTDIIDVNPPLIWFVSIPAAWLVKIGLGTEAEAIRLYIWVLCAASLTICYRLLLQRRDTGIEGMALLTGAAFAMAILPNAAFAQREHLAFVLGLPYCLLLANRIEESVARPRGIAVVCGALAGIAFGFKPWLLAVPLLLELLHFAKVRKLRNVLRTETVSLAVVLLIYLAAVLFLAWDYLAQVVPMGVATYWAYDVAGASWFHWRAAVAPLLAALVCLGIARSMSAQTRALSVARVLTVAFAGFSLSNWAQNKGFAYHAYPALAVAVTLFFYSVPVAARALLRVKWPIGNWLRVSTAVCLIVVALNLVRLWSDPVHVWIARFDMRTGEIGVFRSQLIARINASVPRGEYVYAFSSHPFPAFPTMSYTAAEWGSPMVGQFAIPAFLARDRVKDPKRLAALDRAVQAQREQVIADFSRHPPSLVLVETQPYRLGMEGRKFDDIEFYSSDPRFAALWRQYVETPSIGTLRIFVRRQEIN
jgi:hypothetical protein